jgi:type II secretory pathway component PulF
VITLLLWKVVPIFATLFLGLGRGLAAAHSNRHRLSNFIGSIFGLLILMAFVATWSSG